MIQGVEMKSVRRLIAGIGALTVTMGVAIAADVPTAAPIAPLPQTNSPLKYHNGYWVSERQLPGLFVPVTIINDMHVDPDTNRVTVYAQMRAFGQAVAPAQVGPGECTIAPNGETACFHPNAVYLNGTGVELAEAEGTGAWWVKHSWTLGGEGYLNCELKLAEIYDDCFWVEGVLLDDGMSMRVGSPEAEVGFYNVRTPLLDAHPIGYQVTRYGPRNMDPEAGEIDLTPTVQFVLEWVCREEVSAFDNYLRDCPTLED